MQRLMCLAAGAALAVSCSSDGKPPKIPELGFEYAPTLIELEQRPGDIDLLDEVIGGLGYTGLMGETISYAQGFDIDGVTYDVYGIAGTVIDDDLSKRISFFAHLAEEGLAESVIVTTNSDQPEEAEVALLKTPTNRKVLIVGPVGTPTPDEYIDSINIDWNTTNKAATLTFPEQSTSVSFSYADTNNRNRTITTEICQAMLTVVPIEQYDPRELATFNEPQEVVCNSYSRAYDAAASGTTYEEYRRSIEVDLEELELDQSDIIIHPVSMSVFEFFVTVSS